MPKILVPLDLNKNEIQNARKHNLAAAPSSPTEGLEYYDTVTKIAYYWNGTSWIAEDGSSIPDTDTFVTGVTADDGTITIGGTALAPTIKVTAAGLTHTYISDFDAQVRTSRLDQMAAPTADVSLNSQKLTNVTDPASAQDAATKGYVDTVAQGIRWKQPVTIVTTAALAANTYNNGTAGVGATLTENANNPLTSSAIDFNLSPAVGSRILVKNEASALKNGIYVVTDLGSFSTKWVLTRVTDADTPLELTGAAVLVTGPNTFPSYNQGFVVDNTVVTVGTTNVNFVQFTGISDITFNGGLTTSGNTAFIDPTWTGQVALTTLGTVTTGTWGASTIAVNKGGTGATTAAGARTNLGATGKYVATIGDGVATSITVNHLLGTPDCIAKVKDAITNVTVDCDTIDTDANNTTFIFTVAPALNAYTVVIIG